MDYDDLLLYWHALLTEGAAEKVRKLFDCVLVDEYQDTNALQADILYALSPEGKGMTVVGDDAQSIYAFRAATVRNILDFPKHYPNATIITLEQNYRSTQPILEATNRVIDLSTQLNRVRKFYQPLLETKYDHVESRLRDLEQLELIASRYSSRQQMLTEITLDPPSSTQDLAGPPQEDDDYLVLSTIHSAKGLEWDAVYVIHAADGNIPSGMATKNPAEIEEELRLFYVALTRAKNHLYVCYPLRYYWPGRGDHHSFAQRTRFLPDKVLECFEQRVTDQLDGRVKVSQFGTSRITFLAPVDGLAYVGMVFCSTLPANGGIGKII